MTLLTLCQDVAQEIGFEIPNFVVGNIDATARQLLVMTNREGQYLVRRHNWSFLQNEHSITTVVNQETYALPIDFMHIVGDSFWNFSSRDPVRGPINPSQWQQIKSSGLSPTITYNYRIALSGIENKIYLDPVPTNSGEQLKFAYISKNWVISNAQLYPKTQTDNDSFLLPENLLQLGLIWRFLQAKGLEFNVARLEYEQELSAAIARDTNLPSFRMGTSTSLLGAQNLPSINFGQ